MKIFAFTLVALAVGAASIQAQEANPTQQPTTPTGGQPIFRVSVVSRSTPAVNFHHRQGSTKIDLRGTALMPAARGDVKVESNTGATKMHIETDKMDLAANKYGPEFLTYVLWAVTPEGNAKNLGELVQKGNGDHAQLDATTDLQTFGLIVTAEPYWSVSQPSDVVVMENFIRADTTGTIQTVEAKYQLLQRGSYTLNINASAFQPMTSDIRIPLQLREAREAVAIARSQGAEHYANDTLQKALMDLQNAEGFYASGHQVKQLETVARNAAQMAEDARLIAIRSEREESLAAERAAAADRQAKAEANAREQELKAQQANSDRQAAMDARAAADKARADAEALRAQADQARKDAEAARAIAMNEQLKAQQDADAARASAANAEAEKAELRKKLLAQLSLILETRDTARGLIVNMSDVLFDFGKATLRPTTREKLAKVSGILIAYPTLRVQIEGHTDSVGSEEFNQVLSEKRAYSVRDYLAGQGVQAANLTAVGFGKTKPIASNDTADGRQRNRRVEMVVSGDVIGTPVNPSPTASLQP